MSENKPIPTAGVILLSNDKKKVLLVKHGEAASHINDTFGIPGGRIDQGEEEIETATRELQEETGLGVSINNLIEVPKKYTAEIERKNGEKKVFVMTIFICQEYTGELQKTEETDPVWTEIDKMGELNLLPNIENMVLDSLKHIEEIGNEAKIKIR